MTTRLFCIALFAAMSFSATLFALDDAAYSEQSSMQPVVERQAEALPVQVDTIPENSPFSSAMWAFTKTLLILGLILALMYLVLHKGFGKIVQKNATGRYMQVTERIALSPKSSLHLVEIAGERVVIGESEKGLFVLQRFTHQDDTGSSHV